MCTTAEAERTRGQAEVRRLDEQSRKSWDRVPFASWISHHLTRRHKHWSLNRGPSTPGNSHTWVGQEAPNGTMEQRADEEQPKRPPPSDRKDWGCWHKKRPQGLPSGRCCQTDFQGQQGINALASPFPPPASLLETRGLGHTEGPPQPHSDRRKDKDGTQGQTATNLQHYSTTAPVQSTP